MSEKYVVHANRWRGSVEGSVYFLMAVAVIIVAITENMPFLFRLVLVFLSVLLLLFTWRVYRVAWQKKPLYVIDKQGVTDFTQTQSVYLLWKDVLKIEMTPNNSSLQIGILAKSAENNETIVNQVKNNVKNNGNFAIYTIMIDGFKFSGKQFNTIFAQLKQFGVLGNPSILVDEYLDPTAKRKIRDRKEAIYRQQHPNKLRTKFRKLLTRIHIR